MNIHQTNDLNMFLAVKLTLNKHNSLWSSNPVVQNAVNSFNEKIILLQNMDMSQKANTKGSTINKEQGKQIMLDYAYAHVQAGIAFANASNNAKLKNTLNYSPSTLKKLKDTDCRDVCLLIYNSLEPHINDLNHYGVNSNMHEALHKAINDFEQLLSDPRSEKASMVYATQSVEQLISDIKSIFKNTLDPLMEQYKKTQAAFYSQYHNSRIVINLGSRTATVLSGVVSNGSKPIANALVNVLGTSKEKKTLKDGKFKFLYLEAKTYTITVSAKNYQLLSQEINLRENENNQFTLVLTREVDA